MQVLFPFNVMQTTCMQYPQDIKVNYPAKQRLHNWMFEPLKHGYQLYVFFNTK